MLGITSRTPFRKAASMALGFVVIATMWVAPVAAGAPPLPGHFSGESWGNRGNAASEETATRMGRSAFQPCPCLGTDGEVRSNNVHGVRAGNVYQAGELVSTAQAEKQAGSRAFVRMTSRVTDVRALDGLVTADAIDAVATARATLSRLRANAAGSGFVGLRIAGQPVDVAPGERIRLADFGHATLFNVSRFGDGTTSRGIRVEMMRIFITRENELDIPVGSVLTIGHARAGYSRMGVTRVVGAAAWGSEARSTSGAVENRVGRSAAVYMGCFGRGTSVKSNHTDSTSAPGILTTSNVRSTVRGSVDADAAVARAATRLEDAALLDDVVTADVIRGVARATLDGSGGSTSFQGSRFVNLHVMGEPFGDDVAPNTEVDIPGLGRLTLFATKATADADDAHASVFMVVLDVTVPNALGIPVGTELRLARARANAFQ